MAFSGDIFTVGEAVRSTCGNSHDEEENEEDHFHLSSLKPSYEVAPGQLMTIFEK